MIYQVKGISGYVWVCAGVCAGVRGYAQVCASVHTCTWVGAGVHGCVEVSWCLQVCMLDEFSKYLLETRLNTSADFNTYPIRII